MLNVWTSKQNGASAVRPLTLGLTTAGIAGPKVFVSPAFVSIYPWHLLFTTTAFKLVAVENLQESLSLWATESRCLTDKLAVPKCQARGMNPHDKVIRHLFFWRTSLQGIWEAIIESHVESRIFNPSKLVPISMFVVVCWLLWDLGFSSTLCQWPSMAAFYSTSLRLSSDCSFLKNPLGRLL